MIVLMLKVDTPVTAELRSGLNLDDGAIIITEEIQMAIGLQVVSLQLRRII